MYVTKRPAFAMILAIFVVLLVAMGGVMLLNKASLRGKSIGDNYLKAQAELLAESATEFAVMRAQGDAHAANSCLNELNITVNDASNNPMFDVNVSLAYSFMGAATSPACTTLASLTGKTTMILIDTTVTDHNLSTEPIRVHRRSWQKL
ncbi:MAG: hypothetical protein PHW64_01365 [Sulfuricurvum sp.]|nr:hypothetical protein [Sulfuricurvum sp.]